MEWGASRKVVVREMGRRWKIDGREMHGRVAFLILPLIMKISSLL